MSITAILDKTNAFEDAAIAILEQGGYRLHGPAVRLRTSFAACDMARDHSAAVRRLVDEGLTTSAVVLIRAQAEALARALWLLYAASEDEVEKLIAPLTLEGAKVSSKMPTMSEMVKRLEGKGPPQAFTLMRDFKVAMLPALNSYVHAGNMPLHRHRCGLPDELLLGVVRNSNGLLLLTLTLLATLTGDLGKVVAVGNLQTKFSECLPATATW